MRAGSEQKRALVITTTADRKREHAATLTSWGKNRKNKGKKIIVATVEFTVLENGWEIKVQLHLIGMNPFSS